MHIHIHVFLAIPYLFKKFEVKLGIAMVEGIFQKVFRAESLLNSQILKPAFTNLGLMMLITL